MYINKHWIRASWSRLKIWLPITNVSSRIQVRISDTTNKFILSTRYYKGAGMNGLCCKKSKSNSIREELNLKWLYTSILNTSIYTIRWTRATGITFIDWFVVFECFQYYCVRFTILTDFLRIKISALALKLTRVYIYNPILASVSKLMWK